ncbi:copper resistance CopC/CopD family protein [Bradyrhizobium canariense]|uniref:Copper transport protein n=1 Tax=Bradyrhizobium canariense TaxID=255045 RepID=A0A1H1PN89_9BRAD|nr:CopD family protein [Bradyrhizobium canariense]SDS12648.1 copper transport protein [Bradyrhizobium canariense]
MRLIAGLATLLWVLCFATGAFAHASLVSAEPSDGSVVAVAPKVVQLRFNESVAPAVISLIDASGKTRDDVTVRAVDESIFITLPENLPRGTEVVSYRVISQDGHPVGGSLVFSIGEVTGAQAAPTGSSLVAGLIWLARIGVYLGLFAGVGGVFFVRWIGRARAASTIIVVALAIGLVSAVASLGLQGLDALNLRLGDALTLAPWQAALATSLAPSLAVAVVAMGAALIALRMRSAGMARTLAMLAMAGVGISLAASGHAATAPPQWLTRPTVFLHGVGVAFWVGAFAPLVAMTARPKQVVLPILNRFSRAAVPVVGVLVLTGLTLAIIQLESFRALIETPYGLLLSIKLSLVIVLLGLAALNRFRLTPALAAAPSATQPLVRSILLEYLVAAAILAAVAGWRFTPPPRALAAALEAPLAIHIHTEDAMFQVLVSPGKVGTDSFVLQLMQGDASPLPAKEATLILSLPERGIEPFERPATLGDDGYWHVRDVPLPYPGRWHMRIEALVTDFKKVALEDELDVPRR